VDAKFLFLAGIIFAITSGSLPMEWGVTRCFTGYFKVLGFHSGLLDISEKYKSALKLPEAIPDLFYQGISKRC
jgi:hypothetical protein